MALPPSSANPYLTPRMEKMLNYFQHDNYVDLMEVIYEFADDDLNASRKGVNKKSLESSMARLCRDRLGERQAFQLLLSIPPMVIRRIIKGDIAPWYSIDSLFRPLFYKMNMTHGIYLYTFTIRREDEEYDGSLAERTLTRLEIVQVVEMMKRYKNTRNMPGNEEAVRIDNAYKSSKTNGVDTLNEGTRVLLGGNDGKAVDMLCNTLLQRWLEAKDPNGETRQLQAPCGVGYSKNLATRGNKPIGETLTTSTKPWVLFCSCLKVMGLDVNRISIPILKIWNDEQRELGEILVTMLAGSLVEDGGFNPVQAGSSNGSTGIHTYEEEKIEVLFERDILRNNITTTEKLVASRNVIVSTVTPLLEGRIGQEVAEKIVAVEQLGAEISAREVVIENGLRLAEAELAAVQQCLEGKEEDLEFEEEFDAWMTDDN